jgi:pimeloyl-ACP methyl ester carboxylesterase
MTAKNVVLVHGAWADGTGWRGVYDALVARGFKVSIAQIPLTSFADDIAATKRVLARQDGPTVLVGHSYGGAVISEAGNADNVTALVYVAAFMPDAGESLGKLTEGGGPPPVQPSADGFLFFDPAIMPAAFAGDLPPADGAFVAASQVPIAAAIFATPVTTPAWKTKPVWQVVSKDDRIIPPDAQRAWGVRAKATAVEVAGSHVVFMSQPAAVSDVIETAAKGGK